MNDVIREANVFVKNALKFWTGEFAYNMWVDAESRLSEIAMFESFLSGSPYKNEFNSFRRVQA